MRRTRRKRGSRSGRECNDTHLGLQHVRAVQAELPNAAVNVQRVRGVQLLQEPVQCHESARSTHARADGNTSAVDRPFYYTFGARAGVEAWRSAGAASLVPAVHDGGTAGGTSVDKVSDGSDKVDQRLRAVGNAVIGPHGEVEVANRAHVPHVVLLSATRERTFFECVCVPHTLVAT